MVNYNISRLCQYIQERQQLALSLELLLGFLDLLSDIKSFSFSFSLQPKGFRRYYSSPLLIHEQFGCIKEVMPIGELGRGCMEVPVMMVTL